MIIKLKPGTIPVKKLQHPLPIEAWAGILPHINRLKQAGILVECQSAWNTLILPVKKEGQDYRPVQDLRLVNQATVTLHPTVPNPYTLLSLLPPRTKVYTCLDLKDVFFCIHLASASQSIFAFEWEDPVGDTKQQFTWTHLPQGFKNSPTIFGEAMASKLDSFQLEFRCWLLQHVDDLLLAAKNSEECWEGTKALLEQLMESGYQVSKKKAQICKEEVRYLGFVLRGGTSLLDQSRKEVILRIPQPRTRQPESSWEPLGSIGFGFWAIPRCPRCYMNS